MILLIVLISSQLKKKVSIYSDDVPYIGSMQVHIYNYDRSKLGIEVVFNYFISPQKPFYLAQTGESIIVLKQACMHAMYIFIDVCQFLLDQTFAVMQPFLRTITMSLHPVQTQPYQLH